MASLIATLARIAFGQRPELVCGAGVWTRGVGELRKRSGGRRESGAFLLGHKSPVREIEEFIFYDDLDPNALKTGIVKIDGRRLGNLWQHCRDTGRTVVADVHVHPGSFHQSASDRANPIIAEVGHLALIIPDYATLEPVPGKFGIYEYLGARTWRDRTRDKPAAIHFGWWPLWR